MGAGGQGGPAASIMARDDDIQEITIGDININAADKIKDYIGSPKIKTQMIDASDIDSVASAAKDVDVLIDLVTPKFYYNILQAALKAKVNYVNSACENDNDRRY